MQPQPDLSAPKLSRSKHCEMVLQDSATLWQLNCSCQHFLCELVRSVCLDLHSAGTDSEEKVVNVVSHSPLVGQH